MAPLPANATVYCDKTTGAWVPKSGKSGGIRANSTGEGFDQIGQASYEPDKGMVGLADADGG